MKIPERGPQWTRRDALKLGATLTGGFFAASLTFAQETDTLPSEQDRQTIETILRAKGKASEGVFSVDIDRKDIHNLTLHDVPIKPSFQIDGNLFFQKTSGDRVMMNADFALKPDELDRFIEQLVTHDIVFQAEHQHMFEFTPIVWFVHFRADGDARKIAEGVRAALDVTSAPFPQSPAEHPTTPLPADQIGQILGAKPEIKSDGVVICNVPRREQMVLGGITINPQLNVASQIAFQPVEGEHKAAAIPDFSLIAAEIQPVVRRQMQKGWDIGCLYNQEIAESPQLYFSHQFKTGDPLDLARDIRSALNLMNVKFS